MDKLTLNKTNQNKWVKNLLIFLIPLGGIYLGAVGVTLALPDHKFSILDFIPNAFIWGSIITYVSNGLMDYYRKLRA